MSNQFDLIVIGSGPGGEGAAMKATKEGKKLQFAISSQTLAEAALTKEQYPVRLCVTQVKLFPIRIP